MPVWGTVLLAVVGGWLLLSVVVALAVGRAIRIADERSPRMSRARLRRAARHPARDRIDVDLGEAGERRQRPR